MPSLASIEPLQRLTLFEALAARIEEWILSGQVEIGAKLPSEDALASQFAVSRPVVREALARLRARGLIETVNGSGTFVQHPSADHLADAVVRHLRVATGDTASIAKVYEARIAIEVTTARLAAERATDSDLEEIAAFLDNMRQERNDLLRWTAADLGFHLAVAGAAHNPFLSTLLAPLMKVIETVITESFRSADAVEAGLRAHEAVWFEIKARAPVAAGEAMHEHLVDSELRLSAARSGRLKELT